MKGYEFYTKRKASYPPLVSPVFSKKNWWQIFLVSVVAILSGPLIVYKRQRSIPFIFNNYLRLTKYYFFIIVPLVALLIYVNWREYIKQKRGYRWVGEFDVIGKRSSFLFCYLLLAPGNTQLKVSRNLFERTRVGDCIRIRRDAFGKIEDTSIVDNFSSRIARARRLAKLSRSLEPLNFRVHGQE